MDILLIAQLIRVARAPDAVEKIWRGAHHRTNLPDLQRRVIALGQRADAHGHVDALLHHVHHAVDQQRIDLHVRVGVEILGDARNQVQLAEHHRRGHGESSTRAHAATGGQFLGLLQLQQDAPAVFDVALTSLGQAQAARAAGSSSVPKRASSAAMARVTLGGEMPSSLAPPAKLSASVTASSTLIS
ncbi:hypothetical protein ACP89_03050 [Pseudomonas oleovorans]|nr:hypothetical protein [Pseudomonas oleovorans]